MAQGHEHEHGDHEHGHPAGASGHGHTHDRGLWALKWSFVGLMATALIQAGVFAVSGSVGPLADTIHNFADAATAIPLGVAFLLAKRHATRRFTYGLGRVEDVAGLAIIVTITASAVFASYEAMRRSTVCSIRSRSRCGGRSSGHP